MDKKKVVIILAGIVLTILLIILAFGGFSATGGVIMTGGVVDNSESYCGTSCGEEFCDLLGIPCDSQDCEQECGN